MTDSLDSYLRAAGDVSLVAGHTTVLDRVPRGVATVVAVPRTGTGGPGLDPDRWDAVTMVMPDRLTLRATAPDEAALPGLGQSRRIAVWLASGPGVAPRPSPSWPTLVGARSRRLADGSWLCVLSFASAVSVAQVLVEVARQSVRRDIGGNRGLWVADLPDAEDAEVPADVVRAVGTDPLSAHPVLGRAPVLATAAAGPDALGPLDERVLNPIGFPVAPTGPVLELRAATTLTEARVAELRPAAGVLPLWPDTTDLGFVRTLAGLAMTGAALTTGVVPTWAADLLGGPVVAALTVGVDLEDVLAREEHSLVLRRAALDTFSTASWRRRTGARAGVRVAGHPPVSVVLATRRPEMVDFALRQVGRQRGVDLELVLAPHGFDLDRSRARAALGEHVRLVVVPQPDDRSFGDVLHEAVGAASGDLILKMDDDDWYSPDVVADLLRARSYSGAEVVGMPAEFHYLTEPGLTVRRGHTTEVYARFVAGGTLMIERSLLREVGGFRSVRRYVDAQLLAGVSAAGGSVYRTHGLGYVLRRNPSGHTWQVDLDYLLDPSRVARRWDGFRPSRLVEAGQ